MTILYLYTETFRYILQVYPVLYIFFLLNSVFSTNLLFKTRLFSSVGLHLTCAIMVIGVRTMETPWLLPRDVMNRPDRFEFPITFV